MSLYSNNFIRDDGDPYGDVRQIGHGWNTTASSRPTPPATDTPTWWHSSPTAPCGSTPTTSSATTATPTAASAEIGHGWNTFDRIIA